MVSAGDRSEWRYRRRSYFHPVEWREVWNYDDTSHTKTLIALVALCPKCHEVKHMGRAAMKGNLQRAASHLAYVNGWSPAKTKRYIQDAMDTYRRRSQFCWSLDLSWLEALGVQVTPRR